MAARTFSWGTASTANWNTPADWNNAGNNASFAAYPGQGNTQDLAVIDQGAVSLNVSTTINELNVGSNGTLLLNQANFSLNVNNGGNGATGGAATITLSGQGAIDISAAANLNTVILNVGSGSFIANGVVTASNNVTVNGTGGFNQTGGQVTVTPKSRTVVRTLWNPSPLRKPPPRSGSRDPAGPVYINGTVALPIKVIGP